jgi:hypothetical protein
MGKVQGRTSEESGLVGTQEAVNTTIIQVPFDSGHKNERMGCGPARLLRERSELPDTRDVSTETVEIDDPFPLEVGTASQLAVVFRQGSPSSSAQLFFFGAGGKLYEFHRNASRSG